MQLRIGVELPKGVFEDHRAVLHSIFKSLVLLLLVTLVLFCLKVVFENHLLLVRLWLILHDIIYDSVLIIVCGL